MFVPLFSADQYIDADSLNAAAADASGALGIAMAAILYPGLISADSAGLSVSGLAVTANLPAPFGVLFSTGVLSQAHGAVNGVDTQSYVTNLSGLVPGGSGSVTAYLVASYLQIQQNPIAITGPPPGHPDFNPNFIPYTAYGTQTDSLSLSATSGVPDNASTFELCRFTLTSGTVNLASPNRTFQVRHAGIRNIQTLTPAIGATLNSSRHQQIPVAEVYPLPAVSGMNGVTRTISARGSGLTSVLCASGDVIYGCYPTPAYPAGGLFLLQGQACQLLAANGVWQVIAGSPWISMYRQLLTSNLPLYCAPSGSDTLNTGLSPASPFQNPDKAYQYLTQNFDLGGLYTCQINIAAGSYRGQRIGGRVEGLLGHSQVVFVGAGSGLTSLVGVNADGMLATGGAQFDVRDFASSATGSGALQGSAFETDIDFNYIGIIGSIGVGVCFSNHFIAGGSSVIARLNGASVAHTGGAKARDSSYMAGLIYSQQGVSNSFQNAPNFSLGFAVSTDSGVIDTRETFDSSSGTVTGPRFLVDGTSRINTFGGGVNYYPGSSAGAATNAWNYT